MIRNRRCSVPFAITLLFTSIAWAEAPAPNPQKHDPSWLNAPKTYDAPDFRVDGMKAIFFDGPTFQGKPTRAFAWVGLPKIEAGKKVPGMVLVHGGGGTAFSDWVKLWNSRGYAAIAMDTCGQIPKGTYGHWERHEHGGPAGWNVAEPADRAAHDQWPYQAVGDVMLAHSLLRSMPEVDADRIGLTGISWGGYLTCIVAGMDDRFKLAVPVYGCGFLGDNSVWLGDFAKLPDGGKAWLSKWDPSVYLANAKMPMLWVTGTNDFAYPMDSLQNSYRLPKGPRAICLKVRMPHGHGGAGENPEEIHAFADSILREGKKLAVVKDAGHDGNKASASYVSESPIVKAEFTYTKDDGVWQKRNWETLPADVLAADHKVTATIPAGTKVYYFNLIDDRGLYVSTEHILR